MDLLTLVIVIVLILWLVGAFFAPFGGSLIHLLIVLALVLVVIRLAKGERIL